MQGTVRALSARTGETLGLLRWSDAPVTAVAVLGASGRVAVGSDDGKVAVADVTRVCPLPKRDDAVRWCRCVAHATCKTRRFAVRWGHHTQSAVLATFSAHSRRVSGLATALDGKVPKDRDRGARGAALATAVNAPPGCV